MKVEIYISEVVFSSFLQFAKFYMTSVQSKRKKLRNKDNNDTKEFIYMVLQKGCAKFKRITGNTVNMPA